MKYIVKVWEFIGKSDAWLFLFVIISVCEFFGGSTLKGMFYSAIFLFGYFLSRIAEALEKK